MHTRPVALVTGGGRGIGRGICMALSRAGYAVAVNYAGNAEAARATQDALGTEAMSVQADVANSHDRDRLVDEVLTKWGRIDVLVNNAGITSPGRPDLLESTEAGWDQVLGINLKGPFFLTQRVAREMLRLGAALDQPAIVTVSSISAEAVSVNRGDYCISKAGLGMLTKLFAARLAALGIRAYEVRPGIIDTDMTAGVHDKYDRLIADGLTPIRRWGSPDDVGQAVAALVRGAIPFSTGGTFHVDGGFHIRQL